MSAAATSKPVSVSRALASSTRADIYEHLRRTEQPLTVRDVAGQFDLHPNVARSHLGLLADAGLVSVGQRKHPGGGRPAKIYRARSEAQADRAQLDGAHPGTSPAAALIVRILVKLLDDEGPTLVTRALQAAEEEGRTIASADTPAEGLEDAVARAVKALRAYAPETTVHRSFGTWAEISGFSRVVTLVERVDPALAESIELGLLRGALRAQGVSVRIDHSDSAGAGRAWRIERVAGASARADAHPAARLDVREESRETAVVTAMRAITQLGAGEVLEVLAAGPGSPAAFARWADRAGHVLLAVERAEDRGGRAIRLLIRKAS